MSAAAEIASRVRITDVWEALGGAPPKFRRAPAFWRETRDRNVSLNDAKGAWYDFRDNIGGGILDLVQHVRAGSRADALRWLADHFGLPLEKQEWTPEQRVAYARRRRAAENAARPLAQCALWWLQERMADLDEAKAAAITESGIDIDALSAAARELCRLQRLGPDDVLAEYLRFKAEHPIECSGLVQAGRIWDNACQAAIRAVVGMLAREQQEVAGNAA